jgi:K+/H+ antiporter YhaU regulatory subunit KhtT
MAEAVLHPRMLEFFDLVTSPSDRRMTIAEVTVGAGSICDGASLGEAKVAARYGVTVLGIVGVDGSLELHPSAERCLAGGETLLALGEEEDLEKLAGAVGG